MFKVIRQSLAQLSPSERVRFTGVLAAMLVTGILQMAGVGIILPFVTLLSNPDTVHSNFLLQWLYTVLGFDSNQGFLFFIGTVLLVLLIASNIFTAAILWLMTHFAWGVQQRISARLLAGYLHQPYEAFINRNSADIGKNILVESEQFTNGVLMPMLRVAAFGITALMIVGFLLWLEPRMALVVAVVFGGAYLLVYLVIRRMLLRMGTERMRANTRRFQAVNEAFGSVKEVKLLGRENAFLQRYEPAAATFATALANNQVISVIPRYAIEGLAFGVIMIVLLYLIAAGQGLQSALPVASTFLVAGYRLLPALQQVYIGLSRARFNSPVLDTLSRDLAAHNPVHTAAHSNRRASDDIETPSRPRLRFEHAIELRDVGYRYPNADYASLAHISMRIEKNSFVALTGATGAGKTTLADMILGLLRPSEGEITIDGETLQEADLAYWQANLGYVPQDIYLTDGSIASNIAYGVHVDEIDQEAVEKAARIANIHDFITDNLARGYATVVGERGIRISGGQRQRIGIARALYQDPQVIVLDEATSALDNETERRIVEELDAMRGGRTLIVIAHRLTTVQKCHEVFLLRDGGIIGRGSYAQLMRQSQEFQQLVQTGNRDASCPALSTAESAERDADRQSPLFTD